MSSPSPRLLTAADRLSSPPCYEEILSRADDPVEFSSKKELYCRLSDSILIDRGRMSFSLERSTGRKCYTLSARELVIGGRYLHRWKWKHIRDSRFPEVVEASGVTWLDINDTFSIDGYIILVQLRERWPEMEGAARSRDSQRVAYPMSSPSPRLLTPADRLSSPPCFLPSDYEEILSRADDPVEFSSKKELYCRLSDSILIDRGRMSFSLERSTGRKCYTLSVRELVIVEGDTPHYWEWKHMRDSRFPEVLEASGVSWLDFKGRMDCKILSPRTSYAAYLILKVPAGVCYRNWDHLITGCVASHSSTIEDRRLTRGQWAPNARLDGWVERELGEFFSGEGNEGNVEMWFIYAGQISKGLIVEGIAVRPK